MVLSLLSMKLNVRQMQAYAALCLWQFCENLGIRHEAIYELVMHLLSIISAKDLPEWEQRGTSLCITGRGDPLPVDVVDNIPSNILDDFTDLVENCVEVGIVDMYGASTEQPSNFLKNCIDILQRRNVEPPSPGLIIKYGRGNNAWGAPVKDFEVEDILRGIGRPKGP